ncbi:hypothetical protein OS493_035349 [Desmophyllum pertusum]|uniref:Uncharacterized protein n=1 Tax=Desmophyllum pertusum TaxID=174260 RepID=A0A9X0CCC3_9CNID|nr:hypothetical protein OS493_035349 [Desmophyllum pertusum]
MIDASWQIEEPMEIGKLNGRRLYVGGTEGIATIAESLGKQHDMQVHVILNPQHERARLVTPLSLSQMQEGLHHVYKANETLHRNINANVLSSGYLQRNHWIVRDAQTVIAFGAFENRGFQKTVLRGGTGWSVQMGLDAQTKTVYVYDRSSKQWYTTSWIKNKDNNGRWDTPHPPDFSLVHNHVTPKVDDMHEMEDDILLVNMANDVERQLAQQQQLGGSLDAPEFSLAHNHVTRIENGGFQS